MSTRRDFIRNTSLVTAGTWLIPNFLKAMESRPSASFGGNNILVVIQLSGGNDGLNTIVPYRNDLYYSLRPQLAIKSDSVLKGTDELGFHPSLTGLKNLYDQGYLTVINNVGYPNPDRSHFRSMDIWQSASDSDQYLTTGWIGRYLDASCKDCSVAHQAIEIDDTLSLALKGESIKGMAVKNAAKLRQAMRHPFVQKVNESNPLHDIRDPSLHYLYKTLAETASSADYIFDKSKVSQSSFTYPDGDLAYRLKNLAGLIASGIETKIYYVSFSGFDTHIRQAPQHERLLKTYSEAVEAFVRDLEGKGMFDNVMIMTFSEFGRRVAQNASGGTDHGTANNLFLISKKLKKSGFLNGTPDLKVLDEGDLIHQVDFRSVYATLIRKWLQGDDSSVFTGKFPLLDFV